jgi:micrococcal nuclease
MSNRRLSGTLMAVVVLALVTGLLGVSWAIGGGDARRPPTEHVPTSLELPAGTTIDSLQKAYVEEVIDGDTADVMIDGKLYRVRYYGVDTPERGDKCFREATDRNQQLVKPGENIYLLKDAREFDEFSRLLAYVFLKDGTSVDATLVAEGYGEAWRRDGQYRDQIIALQQQAEDAGRGCLATLQ